MKGTHCAMTAYFTCWFALILFYASAGFAAGAASEAPLLNSDFAAVLRSGNAASLRAALQSGASAQARDAAGNTPLMLASAYGDAACMQILLEAGAEVNASNKAGATALLRAATDYDKLRLLVERGADVNARSTLGNTALMLAARPWNSHRAVELLLSRGADARATNNWGATALMAAVAGGDHESIRLLLRHGGQVNTQPPTDHEAFILGGGRNALMWAAFRGDIKAMKMLLDAGADPNAEHLLGTPLSQAAWADQTAAAELLMARGAKVDQVPHIDGYTPLHWAASTERRAASLVKLLLAHGADPNRGGGENVDAFMGTLQTPLMLAQRRGKSRVLAALKEAGATNGTPDRVPGAKQRLRPPSEATDLECVRTALNAAVGPLQKTSIESKQAFLRHGSHQDCVSCHQQFLPMAAIASARKEQASVDSKAEQQLIAMVLEGELKNAEADWEALFHPDPAQTKGYALLACAAENLPPTENIDSWVHHLATIQGKDGQWYNNLPRPPIQTDDIGATALAVHALQRYPLPGRKAALADQVKRARHWLWTVRPENTEGRIYQLLGLAWAGEPAEKLQPLAKALAAEQRPDGGWAQLPGLDSDAYATAQSVYALRIGAGRERHDPAVERGVRFLLNNQLADGTWYVHRRAFPFQPTMDSGFPHGRDSWISAAASSWAVMVLSLPENPARLAMKP